MMRILPNGYFSFVFVAVTVLSAACARRGYASPECEVSYSKNEVSDSELGKRLTDHQAWLRRIKADRNDIQSQYNLRGAVQVHDISGRAVFCNLDLAGKDFSHQNLLGVDFTGSNLSKSDFQYSLIGDTNLSSTCLADANLSHADGFSTIFDEANLENAKLNDASLSVASFRNAKLIGTDLSSADISYSFMAGAIYSPKTDPMVTQGGFQELDRVTYLRDPFSAVDLSTECRSSTNASLTQYPLLRLRKLFQDNGYRGLERQATAAYERAYTKSELDDYWNWLAKLDGAFRFVFFDLTTAYGEFPSRPLIILLLVALISAFVYFCGINFGKPTSNCDIFKVLPSDRFDRIGPNFSFLDRKVELLPASLWKRFGYAILFSAQSAFQIGWKDFNVGSWLSKIQSQDFTLVARGWIKTVSGFQSIISMFLLAMWALTYFGRPFQ